MILLCIDNVTDFDAYRPGKVPSRMLCPGTAGRCTDRTAPGGSPSYQDTPETVHVYSKCVDCTLL